MPEMIIDGRGSGTTVGVSSDNMMMVVGSINSIPSNIGFSTSQVIRQLAGSPATNFILGGVSNTILIENLGSNSIYFAFDTSANPSSSGTGFMYPRDVVSLDLRAGSISIQSSGATSTEVQVITLR